VADSLKLLSGGAANGLVDALAPQFTADTGLTIDGTFGAVGAMRAKLVAGAPADLLILTAALIGDLAREGHAVADTAANLGAVPTCVAVRDGASVPSVGDAAGLRAALLAADAIYFPDPKLATAGIHFAKVLDALGIAGEVAGRLRTFPNGQTAMRELARAPEARPIGCTQVTEILNTPGVASAGPLPGEFALAAVYTVAVAAKAERPEPARHLARLLVGPASAALRQRLGFVPAG
jgi:molybdate transport system substrate-binding protein